MSDKQFMGMPGEAVLAVGKVTIAAGALASAAHMCSSALDGDPGKGQFNHVIREVRRRLDAGPLPRYA